MEEMHSAGYGERVRSFHVLSGCTTVLSLEAPEPSPFGFLWRPHDEGMIDEIVGYWWLIQPLAPLPSLEIGGGTESSNTVILVGSSGIQHISLEVFQKPPH